MIARIQGPSEPPDVSIEVPGSKSLTNRLLLLAALAEGDSRIDHVLFAEDTQRMLDCLAALGIALRIHASDSRVECRGSAGRWPVERASLYVGNAGTVARFLTAACGLGHGTYRLDGNRRMRERPIGPLLDVLRRLGVSIEEEGRSGSLPIQIQGPLKGGRIPLDVSQSSQFLSALLMVLPLVPEDSFIQLVGNLPAKPYVEMTLAVMRRFGVDAVVPNEDGYFIRGGAVYRGGDHQVEPDASSASYFFAVAALTGGRVRIPGIGSDSLQGDTAFVHVLGEMGCDVRWEPHCITVTGPRDGRLRGGRFDLNPISDMTPTLAILAPFAEEPVHIENVGHIRVQESDRLHALAVELGRLGIRVEEKESSLTVYPGNPRPATVQTYDDHRIAMAFATMAVRVPGIEIANPGCVDKTFPNFFEGWVDWA